MNHITTDPLTDTARPIAPLLEGIPCGVAGIHVLSSHPNLELVALRESLNRTSSWQYGASSLSAKGDVAFSRSANWSVFLYGRSNNVQSIGNLLDEIDPTEVTIIPRRDLLKELCWKLLPSAFVFAIHRTTSSACLICDPSSFRPVYFVRSNNVLHFSTNVGLLRRQTNITGINTDKITQMLAFGHRTGRRILWQGIECVSPGEAVFHSVGKPAQRVRFWLPENVFDIDERRRLEMQPIEQTMQEAQSKVEASLDKLVDMPNLAVPCGGGVDSSYLACYFARSRQQKTTVWCINQPGAKFRESDWMEPFSREHGIECKYANVQRENFLRTLLEMLNHSQQPLPGPNYVGGRILGSLAKDSGVEYLLSGELCDTVFGGLSGFYHLSPRFRILRQLSRLPYRYRLWLSRALYDVPAWLLELMHCGHARSAALVGGGDLENAEIIHEATNFRYDGQSESQYLADAITWMQMRTVPSALHAAFYERLELGAPKFEFPFADPEIMKLGINLPYYLKRRNGHNKWLWRKIAAKLVGNTVAFRRKESFPTQTERWLDKLPGLLRNGGLSEILSMDVAALYCAISPGDNSRWTLANCELWARLHCRGESLDEIFEALV